MKPHTSHDVHTAQMMMCTFSEAQTKTCSDIDGDGTTYVEFDCTADGGGLTQAKASPDACVGECVAANCCGMCFIFVVNESVLFIIHD